MIVRQFGCACGPGGTCVAPAPSYYAGGYRGYRAYGALGDQEADNEAAAQQVIAQLRTAFSDGLSKLNWTPDAIANAAAVIASGGLVASIFSSSVENAAEANFKKDAQNIDQLAGDFLRWATNGQRDDGSPYAWSRWTDFANTIASDMSYQLQIALDSGALTSTLANIRDTATATASTVVSGVEGAAKTVEKVATSGWTWALLGLGAVGLVALKFR